MQSVKRFNPNIYHLPFAFFTKRPVATFFIHWMVWILVSFVFYLPPWMTSKKFQWDAAFAHGVLATVNFLLFYLVSFYIVPYFTLHKKKWFLTILISVVLTFLFCYLKFRLEQFRSDSLMQFVTYIRSNILITFSVVVLAFGYRSLLSFFWQLRISKELENQKLKAELSFLKMQINPHFLFNALNNIYSLTVIEKSQRAGYSILRLSDMLRYVLYEEEDDQHKVSLDKEIQQLNDYIDLEKLRHGDDMYLNFSIEGEAAGKRIPPLLLFPLLENAFKYGLLSDPQKPIDVQLKITDRHLHFSVQNYKAHYQKDKKGGIGLPNVKKRLELLYGSDYTFDIRETDHEFIVNLDLLL
jgi:two-component system LytT family sensor kinase